MKAIEYEKQHSEYNVGYALRDSFNAGFIAAKFEDQLNKFHELFPDKNLELTGLGISLPWPDRELLMAFLQCFGGVWQKEPNTYDKTKIDYVQELQLGDRRITLKASSAPPPPSCEIVEEDVLVPAQPEHYEKKRVLKCKPESEVIS